MKLCTVETLYYSLLKKWKCRFDCHTGHLQVVKAWYYNIYQKVLKTYFNIPAGAKGSEHNHEAQAQDYDVEQGLSLRTHVGWTSLARGQPETSEHAKASESKVTPDTTLLFSPYAEYDHSFLVRSNSYQECSIKPKKSSYVCIANTSSDSLNNELLIYNYRYRSGLWMETDCDIYCAK